MARERMAAQRCGESTDAEIAWVDRMHAALEELRSCIDVRPAEEVPEAGELLNWLVRALESWGRCYRVVMVGRFVVPSAKRNATGAL